MLKINLYYNKFELYIIYVALLTVANFCLYGLNHNEIFTEVRACNKKFADNYLIHEFWSYLGTFFIAFFCNLNEIKTLAPKTFVRTDRKTWIKLLYYDNKYSSNQDMTKKYLIFYILTIFFWVLVEQTIETIYLKIFQDLDFWMIELVILAFLNKLVFYNNKIYRHQILAIILTIIPTLLKVGSIKISFYDETEEKNHYTGHLPIYYRGDKYKRIPIGILLYILLISLRSCVNLILKWYMDLKYISHNQILTVYGGIGTFVYGIICLITTLSECKNMHDGNNDNIPKDYCDYLAKVTENKNGIIHFYFDNFRIYFRNLLDLDVKARLWELFIIIIGIIIFFYKKYFSLLVIHYLNPVYIIFSIPFRFLVQKLVSLIYSFPYGDKVTSDKYKIYKLILDTLGDIISSFGFLVYLGILVLDFCNLDFDIVPNIMKRGCKEANASSEISESSDSFYDEMDKDSNKLLEDSEDSIVYL